MEIFLAQERGEILGAFDTYEGAYNRCLRQMEDPEVWESMDVPDDVREEGYLAVWRYDTERELDCLVFVRVLQLQKGC